MMDTPVDDDNPFWDQYTNNTTKHQQSKAGQHGSTLFAFTQSTIDIRDDDDMNYYSNKNILCKILCCMRTCLCLKILHPFGPIRATWDIIVMILLLYTLFSLPYNVAFEIKLTTNDLAGVVALTIDLCLCFDIILNFRTAFFDNFDRLRLITDQKTIFCRYLCGWFFIDFVTSFPFEFVIVAYYGDVGGGIGVLKALRVLRFIRILKIFRLFKAVKLFDGFMSRVVVREITLMLRLLKIICLMMVCAHFAACFWYLIGDYGIKHELDSNWIESTSLIDNDSTNWERYSASWYWAVVTLFTTGYGDITANNAVEEWYCSLCILTGTIMYAYFIGVLTSLVTEGDRVHSVELSRMEEAQAFCDLHRLPRPMARAVMTHVRYHCGYNFAFDTNEIMSFLPPYLQMDVSVLLAHRMLYQIEFFRDNIDASTLGFISLKVRSISCNERYKLYQSGDRASEIYIQRTGESLLTYDDGETRILNRGDVFGEDCIINPFRDGCVECNTWCEFYVIDIKDIQEVLQMHYPNLFIKIWKNIKLCIKSSRVRDNSSTIQRPYFSIDLDMKYKGNDKNIYNTGIYADDRDNLFNSVEQFGGQTYTDENGLIKRNQSSKLRHETAKDVGKTMGLHKKKKKTLFSFAFLTRTDSGRRNLITLQQKQKRDKKHHQIYASEQLRNDNPYFNDINNAKTFDTKHSSRQDSLSSKNERNKNQLNYKDVLNRLKSNRASSFGTDITKNGSIKSNIDNQSNGEQKLDMKPENSKSKNVGSRRSSLSILQVLKSRKKKQKSSEDVRQLQSIINDTDFKADTTTIASTATTLESGISKEGLLKSNENRDTITPLKTDTKATSLPKTPNNKLRRESARQVILSGLISKSLDQQNQQETVDDKINNQFSKAHQHSNHNSNHHSNSFHYGSASNLYDLSDYDDDNDMDIQFVANRRPRHKKRTVGRRKMGKHGGGQRMGHATHNSHGRAKSIGFPAYARPQLAILESNKAMSPNMQNDSNNNTETQQQNKNNTILTSETEMQIMNIDKTSFVPQSSGVNDDDTPVPNSDEVNEVNEVINENVSINGDEMTPDNNNIINDTQKEYSPQSVYSIALTVKKSTENTPSLSSLPPAINNNDITVNDGDT